MTAVRKRRNRDTIRPTVSETGDLMTDLTTEPTDGEDAADDAEWEAAPSELAADVEHELADLDPDAPVVVSAFAGIGGLDLGFERAGYQTGVQIEWDAAASRVLAARFPRAARYGDVRKVDGESVRRSLGGRPVRVLCGGFPCQDLSVAGRRAGLAGERSGLYGELLRLAADLDPDWLVVENVPGLLSADADPEANDGQGYGPGSGFALFLGDVTGYRPPVPERGWRNSGVCHGPLGTAAWRVLDARHFGVAQRRRRVFVVVHPRDRRAPAAVLLEPEGVRWDSASRRPSWARAAAAAVGTLVRGRRDRVDPGGTGNARAPLTAEQDVVTALTGGLGSGGPDAAHAQAGWLVPTDDEVLAADVRNGLLDEDVTGTLQSHGQSYSVNAQPVVVDSREQAQGFHEYPDGKFGLEDYAPPPIVNTAAKILDGRPVGHVEAHGGDDIAPTVTSKWSKGSGGPSGSETPNLVAHTAYGVTAKGNGEAYLSEEEAPTLAGGGGMPGQGYGAVVVGNGDSELSHPVTASGTDGMGRGVPAVAIRTAQTGANGHGVADDVVDSSQGQAVAYSVAVRGRDGGAQAELGEPDVANTLRAGDGGSSRSQLVLPPGVEIPEGCEVVTFDGDIDEEVAARLEAGGAVAFDWQAGGTSDDSWRGKARSWIVKRGDYAGALSTSKVQAVVYAVDKERGVPNDEGIRVEEVDVVPTITADGDPAERTDRGTRIVQTYTPDVAVPLTAGSHAPGVSAPGRRQEDDTNLVAGVAFNQRDEARLAAEQAYALQGQPGADEQLVVFRKSRRAATDQDDETWVEAEHANTLNTFDGGDARATEVIIDREAFQQHGSDVGRMGTLRSGRGDVQSGVPFTTEAAGLHITQDPIHGEGFSPALGHKSTGQGVAVPHAAVRRLTPRECERLQGFPDDWTLVAGANGKPHTDSPRYKQLGNAVCVNVSEWIAHRIAAYEAGELR